MQAGTRQFEAWESRGLSTDGFCPEVAKRHASVSALDFTIKGLRRRCALNTERAAVKPRLGSEKIAKSVCSC